MDAITSLKYIFLTSQKLGFFPYELHPKNGTFIFRESKYYLLYTKFVFGIFIIIQLYLIWYLVFVSLNAARENSSKTVLIIISLCVPCGVSLLFHRVIKKTSAFCFWLNRISGLFSTLKEYHFNKVKNFYWFSFTAAIGVVLFVSFSEFYTRSDDGKPFFFRHEVTATIYYVMLCEIRLFLLLFHTFLQLLRFYYVEIHRIFRTRGRFCGRKFWLWYLRHLRIKDLEMKEFLDFLQDFYMPVVLLQLLWGFSTTLFNLAVSSVLDVPPFIQLLWAVVIPWSVFMTVAVCHYAESEGMKTPYYLHELFIYCDDKELLKEIELFSLQTQHTKLELNVLGFHRLNFSLLYTMIGSLTSYTVILLQFQTESSESSGVYTNYTII